MPTAKNQIFIGLEDDSCYLVRGIFPGGEGWGGGKEGRNDQIFGWWGRTFPHPSRENPGIKD